MRCLQIIIGGFSVFDGFDFDYHPVGMNFVNDPPIPRSGRTLVSGRLERLGEAGIVGIQGQFIQAPLNILLRMVIQFGQRP